MIGYIISQLSRHEAAGSKGSRPVAQSRGAAAQQQQQRSVEACVRVRGQPAARAASNPPSINRNRLSEHQTATATATASLSDTRQMRHSD